MCSCRLSPDQCRSDQHRWAADGQGGVRGGIGKKGEGSNLCGGSRVVKTVSAPISAGGPAQVGSREAGKSERRPEKDRKKEGLGGFRQRRSTRACLRSLALSAVAKSRKKECSVEGGRADSQNTRLFFTKHWRPSDGAGCDIAIHGTRRDRKRMTTSESCVGTISVREKSRSDMFDMLEGSSGRVSPPGHVRKSRPRESSLR